MCSLCLYNTENFLCVRLLIPQNTTTFPWIHVSYSLSPITSMPQSTNAAAPKSRVQSIWKAPQLLQTCLMRNKHRESIQGSNYLRNPKCSMISPKCQKHIVWGLFNVKKRCTLSSILNLCSTSDFCSFPIGPRSVRLPSSLQLGPTKIRVLSNVIWLFTWSWHRCFIIPVGATP